MKFVTFEFNNQELIGVLTNNNQNIIPLKTYLDHIKENGDEPTTIFTNR